MSRWAPKKKRTLFSTHHVADLLEVHPSSVIKWVGEGLLNAHRTPGGHRRIHAKELLRFLREHDMAVPEELLADRTRIIWVDDDANVLKAVKRAAKRLGEKVDVTVYDNGIDGLLAVGRDQPDLVVLDVYMAGLEGVEVCRRLKSNKDTRDITVIVVSGSAADNDEERALSAGALAFFEKPLQVDDVLKLVEAAPLAA